MVQFGIDRLLLYASDWKAKRIGFVTNNAAITATFEPARKALIKKGFNIVRLFSPEHGLDTTGPDGHLMGDVTDTLTGLPVVSLYGEKLAPEKKDFEDLDVILIDLPDIGSRFYTYLWTLTHVLEAGALYGKELIVLDRPNPISGNLLLAEGPVLDEVNASSFIGRWAIPVRHSCTIGELAQYFNIERKIGCALQVITCTGWRRSMFHPDWSVSFIPASPAINTFETALLYPCLCFLEATNISEGRGTAVPFRVAGAPWINAGELADLLNDNIGKAVVAREVDFVPEGGRYAGISCKGVMLHVTDRYHFSAVKTGLLLIKLIMDTYKESFEWAPYKTFVNGKGENHLRLLLGQEDAEDFFRLSLEDFKERLEGYVSVENWREMVGPYLMYED
ncbi:DUF1343 domain-containing protein [Chitinophaga sp.]|uniref:exo-beta-N-acetylmuramidase NamZ family protein n=1 Tax=Chitinophaga sp. TaxID=1869181 RepID=UPI0031E30368